MKPLPQGLLEDILANPESDELRLIAADWWTDNGEDERAELMRTQITLEPLHGTVCICRLNEAIETIPNPDCQWGRFQALCERESGLLGKHRFSWLSPACMALESEYMNNACNWRRGFVEHVVCNAADFLKHADAIITTTPLRTATLTTMPDMDFGSTCNGSVTARLRGGSYLPFNADGMLRSDVARELLRRKYPGIEFFLTGLFTPLQGLDNALATY